MVGVNMRRLVQKEASRAGLSLDSKSLQLLLELVNEAGSDAILQAVLSAIDQSAWCFCVPQPHHTPCCSRLVHLVREWSPALTVTLQHHSALAFAQNKAANAGRSRL